MSNIYNIALQQLKGIKTTCQSNCKPGLTKLPVVPNSPNVNCTDYYCDRTPCPCNSYYQAYDGSVCHDNVGTYDMCSANKDVKSCEWCKQNPHYKPTPPSPPKATLFLSNKKCDSDFGPTLGQHQSADSCAKTASEPDMGCHTRRFQWSPKDPTKNCQCCTDKQTRSNPDYNVYTY